MNAHINSDLLDAKFSMILLQYSTFNCYQAYKRALLRSGEEDVSFNDILELTSDQQRQKFKKLPGIGESHLNSYLSLIEKLKTPQSKSPPVLAYNSVDSKTQEISKLNLSVRSMNCLNVIGISTIDELAELTPDYLMSLPNFGRGCLQEIQSCLETFGRSLNTNIFFSKSNLPSTSKELAIGEDIKKILTRNNIEDIHELYKLSINDAKKLEISIDEFEEIKKLAVKNSIVFGKADQDSLVNTKKGSPLHYLPALTKDNDIDSLKSFFTFCSWGLTGSPSKVIQLRYGAVDGLFRTLEDVGAELGITRERVRQLEAKAVTLLKAYFDVFPAEIINSSKKEIIKKLFGNKEKLSPSDLAPQLKKMPTEMIFMVNIFMGGVKDFAENELSAYEGDFINNDVDIVRLKQLSLQISQQINGITLPYPRELFASSLKCDEEELDIAFSLMEEYSIYQNYIIKGTKTIRLKRAIKSHQLMAIACKTNNNISPIEVNEFLSIYTQKYPDDNCSTRDLEIVFSSHPHLFVKLYEYGWYPINHGKSLEEDETEQNQESKENDDLANSFEEESIRNTLSGILSKSIHRFEDLRRKFMSFSHGEFSKASVGPVLINNQDRFMRYSPSIYGLRVKKNDTEYIKTGRKLLLDESQCELYCHASYVEEGLGWYALWDSEMEYLWATWLNQNNSPLLPSFLYICSPKNWPCEDWEKTNWNSRKIRSQHYNLLEKNRFKVGDTKVSFTDFFSCLIVFTLRNLGSWVQINRTIGARIDDRHSQTLLALMIYLGILKSGHNWQVAHSFADSGKENAEKLIELITCSLINDDRTELCEYLDKLVNTSKNLGWVDETEVEITYENFMKSISQKGALVTDNADETTLSIEDSIKEALITQRLRDSLGDI